MKILQVIPYFLVSRTRGSLAAQVELIYNLSKSLLDRGHQVTIYTTDAFNKTRKFKYQTETIDMHGIKVCEFKSLGNKLGQRHNICISPAMISMMAKQTATFDVIHLHEYRTFQNIVAHHYARKYGVPYVLQAHGSLPRMISKKLLKQIYDTLWGYRLLKDASKVIAVTDIEAAQYKSMGVSEDKIAIIPNGIELSEFEGLPGRGEFSRKYNLGRERLILYLGRIHQIKGLDLLAGAFAELSQVLNNIKLVIAGPDNGYLSTLKRLALDLEINDKVIFTGPLYGQEKLAAYVDADVYVLPSVYDIFAVTVLEAMACGTPVIVTDRCGLADTVAGGQAGLVIPYDKERLLAALLKMLGDDELRQRFGAKGKALVREKFDWRKIAEQIEKVYQEIS